MDVIKDAFLKAFKPSIAVKLMPLGSASVKNPLKEIHAFLKKRYTVVLDERENIIYIEK